MKGFFRELRERHVFKVGLAYLVVSWLVLQLADVPFPALALSPEDASTRYNVACFYAIIGETERSLDLLDNSISSRSWIENDSELDSIRDHPRYKAIVDSLPE